MLIIGSHVGYKKDNGLVGSVKEALKYNSNTKECQKVGER